MDEQDSQDRKRLLIEACKGAEATAVRMRNEIADFRMSLSNQDDQTIPFELVESILMCGRALDSLESSLHSALRVLGASVVND